MAFANKATKDFFVSYNRHDREMAEWIAWQLEEAGYTTVIQAWDFGAGGNFVMEMDQAANSAERTLAVLSPDYLASSFTRPEWMAAFAEDPTSTHRKLIPVRVEECELTGLLAQIVYIDLVGKDEETARETLLSQIKVTERAKPAARPAFKPSASKPVEPPRPAPAPARPTFPTAAPTLWSVPYTRNTFFVGRDAELEELHQALTKGGKTAVTQVLTGLGGIGKTQMALEYAHRYRDEYCAVFWARAGSDQELTTDYAGIAAVLELEEKAAANPAETREAVKAWLAANTGWLLILDNAVTPAAVKTFLPTAHGGRVLLTTRSQEVRALGIAAPLALEQLSPDEAQRFLLHSTGREQDTDQERQAARDLGVELGGLPLALEQAAAYIAQNDTRFQSYLKSYKKRRLTLLDAQAPEQGDYQQSVATTWELNFKAVQQKSPAAIDLLHLSAFLAPDRIPLELLVKSASELGDALADALDMADEDELVVDDLLLPLARYSLLHRQTKTNSYDVHRLVQEVTRMNLDEAQRKEWAERAVRAVSKAFPKGNFENWTECDRLLPHALVCAENIASEEFDFEEAIQLLSRLGTYLRERAQYSRAESILTQALLLRERTSGDNSIEIVRCCNRLAMLYHLQGHYDKSEAMYVRALSVAERALGPQHSGTAQVLNNLGLLYQGQGRCKEAEPLFLRAIMIYEQEFGTDNVLTAQSLNNLAVLYQDQGRYEEAEPLYRRAYDIRRRALGAEHPDTALCLINLAEVCASQCRSSEAGTLYRRGLAALEKALGPEHPDLAYSLNSCGTFTKDEGRFDEAEALYRRAYEIGVKVLGSEHKETRQYREQYAALLRDMGRAVEAAEVSGG